MAMHELLEGLKILASDSDYANDNILAARLVCTGDSHLLNAVSLMCNVEKSISGLTTDVFLETVRKCIKLRSRLPEPSQHADLELFQRYNTLCNDVHSLAKRNSASPIPHTHRNTQHPPERSDTQDTEDSFFQGRTTSPPTIPSESLDDEPLLHAPPSSLAPLLSSSQHRNSGDSTLPPITPIITSTGVPPICTSPYHGMFNTCPCTPQLLSTKFDTLPHDDEDDTVIVSSVSSGELPSLHASPSKLLGSPFGRTLATLKRALSLRSTSGSVRRKGKINIRDQAISKPRPSPTFALSIGPSFCTPEEDVNIVVQSPTTHDSISPHSNTTSTTIAPKSHKTSTTIAPSALATWDGGDEDDDDDDDASVHWYRLVEVHPPTPPSRSAPGTPRHSARDLTEVPFRSSLSATPPRGRSSLDGPAGLARISAMRSHSRSVSASQAPGPVQDLMQRSHSLRRTLSTRQGITGSISRSSSVRGSRLPLPESADRPASDIVVHPTPHTSLGAGPILGHVHGAPYPSPMPSPKRKPVPLWPEASPTTPVPYLRRPLKKDKTLPSPPAVEARSRDWI